MASKANLSLVERHFQAAADLPASERAAYLERECGADGALRERLERMLSEHELGDSLAPAGAVRLAEGPGATIDRYELVEEIGEGGFGVVYLARQTQPVVRQVALKILRLGMDTEEVVTRFEAERQALALMDHPNIAKVLDGGATASGRPYFVMELVEGVAITEYCDGLKLGTRERLELFVDVCDAVQHAHQKGVLHRDIKPSNVLVAERDGRPEPKVIDFGIAKAIHTPLTERTLLTVHHRFLGTPAYMSPEQAEMASTDVDTRTDVYSLGVLLYELLTGSTPFDTQVLLEAGLAGIQRILREEEPPRPSARVSTSGDVAAAARRQLDPNTLGRRLKGDLDWIVMRALEKERARRYGAASDLATDIERFLRDEPVEAGPPSAAYRMGKFLRRNRAVVTWAGLLFVALVAGIVGTTLAMVEAGNQRDDARREAEHAKRVTDFLVGTLALSNPKIAREPDLSVGRLLDRTAADVATALADEPWAEARVRGTIGLAYDALGRNQPAESNLRRAAELMEELEGYPRDELYTVLWSLTHVLFRLEHPDALATAMWARRVGLDHIRTRHPDLARDLDGFIFEMEEAARSSEPETVAAAAPLLQGVIELSERLLPAGDPLWPVVADSYKHAGYTLWYTAHEPVSAAFWEEALAIEERERDPNDPAIAETLAQLVGVLNRAGRAPEAEARIRRSVEAMRGVFREGNFQLAFLEAMLGENLVQQGQYEEAEPYLLASHEGLLSSVGVEAGFYGTDSLGRLIGLYSGWGKEERAAGYRAQLADLATRTRYPVQWLFLSKCLGPDQSTLRGLLDELESICGVVTYSVTPVEVTDERLPAVVAAALAERRTAVDPNSSLAISIARQLRAWSDHLAPAHDAERALILDDVLAVLEPAVDLVPLELAEASAARAAILARSGDDQRARALADDAWAYAQRDDPLDDWFEGAIKARTARSLIMLERFEECEVLLLAAHSVLGEQLGREYRDTREVAALLYRLYVAWGKGELAEAVVGAGAGAGRR